MGYALTGLNGPLLGMLELNHGPRIESIDVDVYS